MGCFGKLKFKNISENDLLIMIVLLDDLQYSWTKVNLERISFRI